MRSRALGRFGTSYYHVVSRVVDRRLVFGDREKAIFRGMLERLLGFSGLRCVTFCLMGNHFHLLLAVPGEEGERFREECSDTELLRRLSCLYSPARVAQVEAEFRALRAAGDAAGVDRLRAGYLARMYDLSRFMQELKGRFTRWFNREHGRKGTLWEERFRSILIEGGRGDGSNDSTPSRALTLVAAYIDLNPVRAGLVRDPKDYRFGGYGEAVAGVRSARAGLATALGVRDQVPLRGAAWREQHAVYRRLLYDKGAVAGTESAAEERKGCLPRDVEDVERRRGRLGLPDLLCCRVRYFTDGYALGGREFLNQVFVDHRSHFGDRRRSASRRMRGGEWGDVFVLRDLRKEVITSQPSGD